MARLHNGRWPHCCAWGRVVLLNRETVLTEATPQEFANANGFRLLPEDNVATNPAITFRVGSFAPTEDFNPPNAPVSGFPQGWGVEQFNHPCFNKKEVMKEGHPTGRIAVLFLLHGYLDVPMRLSWRTFKAGKRSIRSILV
jgi:hypothetical protein